jgi:hypothetical protein
MLHLPHVLRLFMHPHHTPAGSDVLSDPGELCAESVEMEVILPRGYCDLKRGDFNDERESGKKSCVVRRNRRRQLPPPIATGLVMRAPRRAVREGLTPRRSCNVIWRDAWI